MIDGSRTLWAAVEATWGEMVARQRCQEHKKRNLLEHLPKSKRARIKGELKHGHGRSRHGVNRSSSFHDPRIPNSYTEGTHAKIKLMKRLSYRFRDQWHLTNKMFLALLPSLFVGLQSPLSTQSPYRFDRNEPGLLKSASKWRG